MTEEMRKIKKRQTLIMIWLLVQALTIVCLLLKVNSLIGTINVLNGNFLDFQKQINILVAQLNDFIQLFIAFPIK